MAQLALPDINSTPTISLTYCCSPLDIKIEVKRFKTRSQTWLDRPVGKVKSPETDPETYKGLVHAKVVFQISKEKMDWLVNVGTSGWPSGKTN